MPGTGGRNAGAGRESRRTDVPPNRRPNSLMNIVPGRRTFEGQILPAVAEGSRRSKRITLRRFDSVLHREPIRLRYAVAFSRIILARVFLRFSR